MKLHAINLENSYYELIIKIENGKKQKGIWKVISIKLALIIYLKRKEVISVKRNHLLKIIQIIQVII